MYRLLPHYQLEEDLLFLGRERVETGDEALKIIRKAGSHLSQEETGVADTLAQLGILIKGEPKSNISAENLILAAHSDDAVLSLGGRLIYQGQNSMILNVFSSCPVSVNLKGYNLTPEEVTHWNNEEETFFASLVGARLQFLNVPEALERGYTNIFSGVVRHDERALAEDISAKSTQAIKDNGAKRIYCPLSIGNHVDHIILRSIGIELAENFDVVFYEDMPYLEEMEAKEFRLQMEEKTEGMRAIERLDITDAIGRKIDLAAIYKTQYDKKYLSRLWSYALRIDGGKAFERIWKLM